MPTLLPKDDDNNVIPALRLKDAGAHVINATVTSARNSTAFDADTRIISLYATAPVYVRLGGGTVTATDSDHYFPAGIYYDIAVSSGAKGPRASYIAVLRAEEDCTVYISEKE